MKYLNHLGIRQILKLLYFLQLIKKKCSVPERKLFISGLFSAPAPALSVISAPAPAPAIHILPQKTVL